MDAIVYSIIFSALSLAIFLAFSGIDKRITVTFAVICAIYLGLDDLVTGLASSSSAFSLFNGNWNWSGKIYSIVLSALVITALRIRSEDMGLIFKQHTPRLAAGALIGFILWGACLGLLFQPGAPDIETLAFQATMPGVSEELVYRGIAPAILMGAVLGNRSYGGMPWSVIIATAIVFGMWHSLGYSGGELRFNWMSGLFPFIGSVVGGWLRFKTGSLLVPILGHSFANVAFHLAGGIAT